MFNRSKKENTVAKGNLLTFFKQFDAESPEDLKGEPKNELVLVQKLADLIIAECCESGDESKPAAGGMAMSEFSKIILKFFDGLYVPGEDDEDNTEETKDD